jgi:hypothetical protein
MQALLDDTRSQLKS